MSGFRILFRRIAEMLSPEEENGPPPPPGFRNPPTSTQTPATSGGGAMAVCHNPEHIEEWDANEISDFMNLCSGRQSSWIVPFAGNAFVSGTGASVTQSGISSWTSPQAKVSLFVHCVPLGLVHVALRVRAPAKSRIRVSFASCTKDACQVPQSNEIDVIGVRQHYQIVPCGQFQVVQEGYVRIELEGLRTSGSTFGDVSHAILITESGSSNSRVKRDLGHDEEIPEKSCMRFVADPEDFYFGRRGPSVHLNYVIPELQQNEQLPIEYFYNEVYVPSNQDVVGAYFCAIGFNGGYFGIQVNSPTERRILFSIWSDYETDDPSKIPEDFKIALLKKGSSDVYTGEFGNEGSGGQSYLRYPWKADTLYKFLVQARPLTNNETVFTAWFCDSASSSSYNWRLIARFKKPKVATYLKGMYSFSENFIPEMGHVERSCLFGNQWAKDAGGNWREVTTATFSADATAQKQNRKDVGGGVVQDGRAFYLRNCGFFSEAVGVGERFCRSGGCGSQPSFDCNGLP